MACYGGFGNLADGRPVWIGDFDGDGTDETLFYYPGDDNWWLGDPTPAGLSWSLVGNTRGFGHAINDGRPFWIGDFAIAGRDSVLFYYPGDDNWWLGTLTGGQLAWSLAGNTRGFGHAINDGRPFWIGDFNGDGRSDVLFYYPGDGNWWLGSLAGAALGWRLLGNTGRRFDACLGLNIILVAEDTFTAANRQQVVDSIEITRQIYGQVSLGITAIEWHGISAADAGAFAVIDSGAEAQDLTSRWTIPNQLLDVFVVRSMNGADGWSAVNGSCDKAGTKAMTGSVVSLNGTTANSGNTFAHEIGHYLGLDHIPDSGNFIGGNGGSDSWTGIHNWQGDTMKQHCFVRR